MPCIPCDLLSALVAGDGNECQASPAAMFFCELGAITAAKMHAMGSAEASRASPSDMLVAFEEEERLFFRFVPEQAAEGFRRDHTAFRDEIKETGSVRSADRFEAHERAEDQWAEWLDESLKKRAGLSPKTGKT